MHDSATLSFYASEASAYVARYRGQQSHDLAGFLDRLPAGARVLELGCGGGGDTAAMLAKGVNVVPTDGSPEMAQQASEVLGVSVGVLLFEDLNEEEAYDGVWASACLLHVPVADLSIVLSRVRRALRAGGLFYASYKIGVGEGRDRYGRYYNYPTNEVLSAKYLAAGPWSSVELEEQGGGGYDDEPTQWMSVTARKAAG